MMQIIFNMVVITLISVSSNSLWNVSNSFSNETETIVNINGPNKLSISTTYSNTQKVSSFKDLLFEYTMQPPYLFISISILLVIIICSITCCIMVWSRKITIERELSAKRKVSAPPEPFEFALTLTGHSLHGHSKKHSLKIIPALTPDDDNRDYNLDMHEQKQEMEEETHTKTHTKTNEELRNEFMSFSSHEYENEWYDGTLMHDNNAMNEFINETNEESNTEHLRKEIDVKLQNKNRNELKKLSNILENIQDKQQIYQTETDDETSYESYNENDNESEYEWIIKTLIKIDKENSKEFINIFKQNKVTDNRLVDLRDKDWRDLIQAIGIRNEFRKLYERQFLTTEGNLIET